MSREPQTLAEAAAEFNRSMKELQRVMAAQVQPSLERLIAQLNAIARDLYLQRLRPWIPFLAAALIVGIVVGWWLS